MSYLIAGAILLGFGVSVGLTIGALWLLFSSIVRGNGRRATAANSS